jgi:hypothetical protein
MSQGKSIPFLITSNPSPFADSLNAAWTLRADSNTRLQLWQCFSFLLEEHMIWRSGTAWTAERPGQWMRIVQALHFITNIDQLLRIYFFWNTHGVNEWFLPDVSNDCIAFIFKGRGMRRKAFFSKFLKEIALRRRSITQLKPLITPLRKPQNAIAYFCKVK